LLGCNTYAVPWADYSMNIWTEIASMWVDQVRQLSNVLRDKLCDRLRPTRVTSSDQSTSTTNNVAVFMNTYGAAFEYANQYNTWYIVMDIPI